MVIETMRFQLKTSFNWKKGLERFERHESTAAHHEAVEMLVCDVGEMLSDSYALETEKCSR